MRTIESVLLILATPQPHWLSVEEAIAFVAAEVLKRPVYGSALISAAPEGCKLSDTVLYSAFEFLLRESLVIDSYAKQPGRGRPRRMYSQIESKTAALRRLAEYAHR